MARDVWVEKAREAESEVERLRAENDQLRLELYEERRWADYLQTSRPVGEPLRKFMHGLAFGIALGVALGWWGF